MSSEHGHLIFSSTQSLYGVPALQTVEILSPAVLTRIPGAPAHVLGIYPHRGELIPVIDLDVLLKVRGPEHAELKRAILVRTSQGTYALGATEVIGVHTVSEPGVLLGDDGVYACLRGPVKMHVGQVVLIDPEPLMTVLARFE